MSPAAITLSAVGMVLFDLLGAVAFQAKHLRAIPAETRWRAVKKNIRSAFFAGAFCASILLNAKHAGTTVVVILIAATCVISIALNWHASRRLPRLK